MKQQSAADVMFESRGEGRGLRAAAVVALLAHFAAFAAVLPVSSAVYDLSEREAVVLKRYRPPEIPPPVAKPVAKKAVRVPIPDPTPDELEILTDRDPDPVHEHDPSVDYLVGMPTSGPEPQQLTDAVRMETEGLVPPRPTHRVQPQYDAERARRGVQGKVDIEIVIGESGLVEYAAVVNGTEDDELDRLAVEAVQQWEFQPATLAGAAVSVRAMVTINFRIY